MEELYKKKGLNDPDNHDGVVTHLDPDILEWELKWTWRSITMNKFSGGDGIPAELFQILKDDAVKVLHSICQQIWEIQQWPQDWKNSVFIPIPKKGNAKECSNTIQLCSSRILIKLSSNSFNLAFNSTWINNFQMYKLGSEKAEEPWIKLPNLLDQSLSKGIPEKHLLLLLWC